MSFSSWLFGVRNAQTQTDAQENLDRLSARRLRQLLRKQESGVITPAELAELNALQGQTSTDYIAESPLDSGWAEFEDDLESQIAAGMDAGQAAWNMTANAIRAAVADAQRTGGDMLLAAQNAASDAINRARQYGSDALAAAEKAAENFLDGLRKGPGVAGKTLGEMIGSFFGNLTKNFFSGWANPVTIIGGLLLLAVLFWAFTRGPLSQTKIKTVPLPL